MVPTGGRRWSGSWCATAGVA
jgi:hypothetical protein